MSKTGKFNRRLIAITNIIQDEVSFFNGWYVPESSERQACEKAAKRILKLITRRRTRKEVEHDAR